MSCRCTGPGNYEVEQFEGLLRLLGRRYVRFGCGPGRQPARWFARGWAGRADAGPPGADGDVDEPCEGDEPGEPANGHGWIQPPASVTCGVLAASCRRGGACVACRLVRGVLTFQDPAGPVTVTGRVVQSGDGDGVRISWHGDLSRRVGQRDQLVTDHGETFHVVVGNGLMRLAPPRPSPSYGNDNAPPRTVNAHPVCPRSTRRRRPCRRKTFIDLQRPCSGVEGRWSCTQTRARWSDREPLRRGHRVHDP